MSGLWICPNCIAVVEHGVFKGVEQVRVRTIIACKQHQYRMKAQKDAAAFEAPAAFDPQSAASFDADVPGKDRSGGR